VEERRWTLSERFYLGQAAIVVALLAVATLGWLRRSGPHVRRNAGRLLTEEGLDDAAAIGRPPLDVDQDYSNRRCV
jgi:hypothetical protein